MPPDRRPRQKLNSTPTLRFVVVSHVMSGLPWMANDALIDFSSTLLSE